MASGMKDCPVDAAIVGIVDNRRSRRRETDATGEGDRRRRRDAQGRELAGITLLVIQPIGADGNGVRPNAVAVDSGGAGVGETVFFVRGKEASFPFHPIEVPADAGIVGIVDHWDVIGPPKAARTMLVVGRRRQAARRRMQIARVVGTVVSTQKHRKFEGAKLLLVQPLTLDDQPRGTTLLAVDAVGAGRHEKVLVVIEGRAAQRCAWSQRGAGRCCDHRHIDQVDLE
jgi:microcompartment protein CcmK/EutM